VSAKAYQTPSRPLSSLLEGLDLLALRGDRAAVISRISHDSRSAGPGTLFVAYRGVNEDVHRYLPDAFARGAAAALVERPPDELVAEYELPPDATLVQVPRAREARAWAAAALHGHPSRDLVVIGVTGTDGKTTTSSLIHAMLGAAGLRAGLISTVSARVGEADLDTGLHVTTPEPEDLQAYLAMMRQAGAELAVLEVTSHGLDQHRVTGVHFDLAVLTNVTAESMEYHGSFEAYREAKARLFWMTSQSGLREPARRRIGPDFLPTAILNADDPSIEAFAGIPVPRQLRYSLVQSADFGLRDLGLDSEGLRFTALTPLGPIAIESTLRGSYNAANILAAMAAAHALGLSAEAMAAGAAGLGLVPGRMESIDEAQDFLAIVDFAHTPNALAAALAAARTMIPAKGRVIAVFGCAGLRDPAKRDAMGRIAGAAADLTVITAEDPRSEDLDAILDAMAAGLEAGGARLDRSYWREPDRGRAIRLACGLARAGDIVIVCGKGHEQSMCFGTTEHPWDDRAAMRAALRGEPYGALPTAE
jgi:UDP-N-acetylmuramoyl-L-alanyl-D-glutamate--2,6-diaminopimelate ligase